MDHQFMLADKFSILLVVRKRTIIQQCKNL